MLIKYWNILKPLPAVCHSLCPVSRRVLRRRRLHKILSTPIRLMSAAPFLASKLVSMFFSNITVEVALFGSHVRISVVKMVWTTGLTPDPLCVLPFNGLEQTYVYAGVIGYYHILSWNPLVTHPFPCELIAITRGGNPPGTCRLNLDQPYLWLDRAPVRNGVVINSINYQSASGKLN